MNKYQDQFNDLWHSLWMDIDMTLCSHCEDCKYKKCVTDVYNTGDSPSTTYCDAPDWRKCPEMVEAAESIQQLLK